MSEEHPFHWEREEEAEALLLNLVESACAKNSFIQQLSKDLEEKTSTRLFDWLDHISLPKNHPLEEKSRKKGFVPFSSGEGWEALHHPGAQLPKIVFQDKKEIDLAVNVESIALFLLVRGLDREIEGSVFTPFRRSCICQESNVSLSVVERRGTRSMEPLPWKERDLYHYWKAKELWWTRPRYSEDTVSLMKQTQTIADHLVALVGHDSAAHLILEGEREYWQQRNRAGQTQRNRQDHLGMGWANHDHHTFRSSRQHFRALVDFFEFIGFHCRERFYAGEEAGWGAQVMENPTCRLVLFLDVDLAPGEIDIDFAHQDLTPLPNLGTIGLWCALHGDSIFQGGMHHLEAQFLFDHLQQDLKKEGISMMKPFSDFSYLRQAFTQGERWPVDPKRIEHLLQTQQITKEQAHHFLKEGAIGSHLENLQRREGYKGFNKKNVSQIIRATDPRS